jgi:hypothetical protein
VSAGELPAQSIEHLDRARSWARLVGIFGYISGVFFLLAMAGIAIAPPAPGVSKGSALGSLVIGVVVVLWFATLLLGYARGLRAFAAGQPGALVTAFRRLRMFWVLLAFGYGASSLFALYTVAQKLLGRVP